MSKESEVTSKYWIVQKRFQFARFLLATILLGATVATFIYVGNTLLIKKIDRIIITPVSKTEIETVLPAATNTCVKGRLDKSKGQIIKKKIETASATQQILAYALQLAAWFGLIGLSLWAVVALTREE